MNVNSTIKSLAALFLLLLFTLGITPRQYLHDLFANHQDTVVYNSQHESDQLSLDGFNCNTHDQVAESSFTSHTVLVTIEPPMLYPSATTQHLISNLRLQAPAAVDLRGPPAIA